MKSIYKSEQGKNKVLELYNKQLHKLNCRHKDIFVDTSYGKTHIIEIENKDKPLLLVFHGGNSTSAYNLLVCKFLLKDFHIFAVDIIGHFGLSSEKSLSPRSYDYGYWAREVIDKPSYHKINCFGGSFGGGVLAKLMCVAPEKIIKSVLIVPSGINNAFPINTIRMLKPLMLYLCTKKENYIKDTAMFMACNEKALDDDAMETIKNSFDYVRTKAGMPSNISRKRMKKYTAPTLVMAGELDCLFPARKVLIRAKKIIQNCTTYEMKSRGHIHLLTDTEKRMIIEFLQ